MSQEKYTNNSMSTFQGPDQQIVLLPPPCRSRPNRAPIYNRHLGDLPVTPEGTFQPRRYSDVLNRKDNRFTEDSSGKYMDKNASQKSATQYAKDE